MSGYQLLNTVNYELYKRVSSSWIIDMKPYIEHHLIGYLELTNQLKSNSKVLAILGNNLYEYKTHKSESKLKDNFINELNIKAPFGFSEKSIENIKLYIRNLIFLFQIKKSAILVTRTNWKYIEDDLFLPMDNGC